MPDARGLQDVHPIGARVHRQLQGHAADRDAAGEPAGGRVEDAHYPIRPAGDGRGDEQVPRSRVDGDGVGEAGDRGAAEDRAAARVEHLDHPGGRVGHVDGEEDVQGALVDGPDTWVVEAHRPAGAAG